MTEVADTQTEANFHSDDDEFAGSTQTGDDPAELARWKETFALFE